MENLKECPGKEVVERMAMGMKVQKRIIIIINNNIFIATYSQSALWQCTSPDSRIINIFVRRKNVGPKRKLWKSLRADIREKGLSAQGSVRPSCIYHHTLTPQRRRGRGNTEQ